MGRRRASIPAGKLLLLAPLGLVALIAGQRHDPPKLTPSLPVQYVSLAADPPRVEVVATPSSAPSQPAASLVPPPETLYVSGHKVPLRAEANGKAAILDRFGPGEAVTVLARSNEWVQVRNVRTQREGWIAKKRPRDEEPE